MPTKDKPTDKHDWMEVPSNSSMPSMASLPRFICIKCGTWDQTEKCKKPCPGVDNSAKAIAWRKKYVK